MAKLRFDITVRVDFDKLALLMELLGNESGIEIIGDISKSGVTSVARVVGSSSRRSTTRRFTRGNAGDGKRGKDLIAEVMTKRGIGQTLLIEELKIIFKNNGLVPDGATSRVTAFVKAGLLAKTFKPGHYLIAAIPTPDGLRTLERT